MLFFGGLALASRLSFRFLGRRGFFLFLRRDRRRRDGRDREVAIGDRRTYALGQNHLTDVQAVVDVGVLQVERDLARYGISRAKQLDLAPDDVEHAATLEAARDVLVDEHHRHGDGDSRAASHADEVDVQRLVGHRVQLHLARQHPDRVPVHLEIAERAEEAGGVHGAPELASLERDQLLRRLVAVHHTGHAPCSAK